MERPSRKRSKSKSTTAKGTLWLMPVDGTRIRQEIKREYEKVVRDLEKARAQLEQFEKKDLPGFTAWVNRQFGALLTELRETSRRIGELQRLLLEIEAEMFYSGTSAGRAYARVMKRHQNSAET